MQKNMQKNRVLRKMYNRKYMLNDSGKYYDDTPIPIWKGDKIRDVVSSIYSGTNFYLRSAYVKKNTIYEKIGKKK